MNCCYPEDSHCWVCRYNDDLELYIAGDCNSIDRHLELAAIRVIENFSLIKQRIKDYLELTCTGFGKADDEWFIWSFNFRDVAPPDRYEASTSEANVRKISYDCGGWVVTLERDLPIAYKWECY